MDAITIVVTTAKNDNDAVLSSLSVQSITFNIVVLELAVVSPSKVVLISIVKRYSCIPIEAVAASMLT